MNTTALEQLLTLAREAATAGPTDRHHDASKAFNELVRMALAVNDEKPEAFHPAWDGK